VIFSVTTVTRQADSWRLRSRWRDGPWIGNIKSDSRRGHVPALVVAWLHETLINRHSGSPAPR